MPILVSGLYRYPVKGLTAESLTCVKLSPGRGFPHDRRFAIAHGTTQYDQTEPRWQPKTAFLQLMSNSRLATLTADFEADSGTLTLARDGRTVARGQVTTPIGRTIIDQFLRAYLAQDARGQPRLVEAPETGLADVSHPRVSIIGEASVEDLARVVGRPVEKLRFRANVYLTGSTAWEELSWVGSEIRLGSARMRVAKPIARCAATTVNPATAERDLAIPRDLERGFGHVHMGVYAEVLAPGTVSLGDALEPLPGGPA
ncbi:MAG: MOSC domain-containing protein [Proteobacteria bacterium]|nr:MOSC domain-containing protein [Pseudomonadota bacterium]MBI3496506.1 MOSC domain-containing protein [Pseudomonadota bacterium]